MKGGPQCQPCGSPPDGLQHLWPICSISFIQVICLAPAQCDRKLCSNCGSVKSSMFLPLALSTPAPLFKEQMLTSAGNTKGSFSLNSCSFATRASYMRWSISITHGTCQGYWAKHLLQGPVSSSLQSNPSKYFSSHFSDKKTGALKC